MPKPKFLRPKEVAEILSVNLKTVYNMYPEWKDRYNVRIVKLNGRGDIRFYESDILKMAGSWEVN